MDVRAFTGGDFGENGYLVTCKQTGAAVAVDPGASADTMAAAIVSSGVDLKAILLTHAHLDHIEGVHLIRALDDTLPIWLHPADRGWYDGVQQQGAMFGLQVEPQPAPDHELVPGESFTFGVCRFDIRFAPGHAPGHVMFVAPEHELALVGDVIFQGSIGRTDLPGGDFRTLMTSIQEQVMTLPDETVLYTGHGPTTTVGRERVSNPFLLGHYDV
jgi:glyoxylase-like metal-dependent hydrolase (beta-lactamase superfamily II)